MLREAVALSPDCPSGHFRLGFALYLLGHDEEAATELARAGGGGMLRPCMTCSIS